ncbi:hypothetical protein RI129_007583 [Pyrocoelia pectoralis]|uniref:Uncharacterized protein n=1 Tax=Pyrocoelia pectoralis TaxID=417401 RepID=A0AAN7VBF3_9COLE
MKKSKSSRIVIVSSWIAHFVKININNFNSYSNWFISKLRLFDYATSKLYNILFANELARRLKGSGITINSIHPGWVRTEIARDFLTIFQKFSKYARDAEEGAQTSIYVALSKDIDHVTGEYFDNCRLSTMPTAAQDVVLAKKIWEVSTDCVQLSKEECTPIEHILQCPTLQ